MCYYYSQEERVSDAVGGDGVEALGEEEGGQYPRQAGVSHGTGQQVLG